MAGDAGELRAAVQEALAAGRGLLFAEPAMVGRPTYSGRSILAPNSDFVEGVVDDRGYVPVEWWIMSRTDALNAVVRPGEGITKLMVGGRGVPLPDLLAVAEKELMGTFAAAWPLTKVLDIGGPAVKPSFSDEREVPPIPAHVHAGNVVCGHCQGPGKLEAYFFPPLDVPPYNQKLGRVITRLGLKPDTTRDDMLAALQKFGEDDSLYDLLTVYDIKPWETWTIPTHVVHAPGPWLTFEIQKPQDDYNLLAWRLATRLEGEEKVKTKEDHQLRGLASEEAVLEETIKWDLNVDPAFEEKWHRTCEALESGSWGRRIQLFYGEFYGEGFELEPEKKYTRKADDRPYACLVWSGTGDANSHKLDTGDMAQREFLVTPGTALELHNTSSEHRLLVYAVFPM